MFGIPKTQRERDRKNQPDNILSLTHTNERGGVHLWGRMRMCMCLLCGLQLILCDFTVDIPPINTMRTRVRVFPATRLLPRISTTAKKGQQTHNTTLLSIAYEHRHGAFEVYVFVCLFDTHICIYVVSRTSYTYTNGHTYTKTHRHKHTGDICQVLSQR